MDYRNIVRLLSRYFFYFSFLLLMPALVAGYYQFVASPEDHPQPHSTWAFAVSFLCSILFSRVFAFFGERSEKPLFRKEGILIVALIWVLSPMVSSLPFIISGSLSNPLHAYFESVSGFSTTGATIITAKKYDLEGREVPIVLTVPTSIPTTYTYWGNVAPIKNEKGEVIAEGIEALGKGVLFWRSLIQWIGGVGIVLFFILVFPGLGIGGRLLVSSEAPGPVEVSLTPRISEAAFILWRVYLFFTLMAIVLLKATNQAMPWFDAINIALTTLPTGGFSVRNTSIGFYQSPATEWVVIFFMILGSLNFAIWFHMIKGKFYKVIDKELVIYFGVILFFSIVVALVINGHQQQNLDGQMNGVFSFSEGFRASVFQVISANSSTGFATTNFDVWPYSAQISMIILMYIGGMAGSTAGGIKVLRNYILFKTAQFKLESIYRPEVVRVMRTTHRQIAKEASIKALIFFFLIISLSALGIFLFILDGLDQESAITLVACHINNVGFSFRVFGPMQSCAFLSNFGMILSCFLMIAGRLEFFAILTLFLPSFWKKYR